MRGLKTPIGSAGARSIDLAGCVLYLPLWRPDMVARGGSIVSGTGTMAETPLGLAVGANTVTATGAGTFIITVPQAGTCASNGATITGSPVTLPAGVATTVTTGVTTGTFTVTTSNIIRSKDSTGHLCTVTGATWTPQGRNFDGADIIVTDTVAVGTGVFAMSCVVKVAALPGTYYCLIGGPIFSDAAGLIMGPTGFNVGKVGVSVGSNVAYTIPLNTFLDVTAVITSTTTADIYVNGIFIGTSTEVNIYTLANRIIHLGAAIDSGDIPLTGLMGEAKVYNRVLSAVEIVSNYQKTKWRY